MERNCTICPDTSVELAKSVLHRDASHVAEVAIHVELAWRCQSKDSYANHKPNFGDRIDSSDLLQVDAEIVVVAVWLAKAILVGAVGLVIVDAQSRSQSLDVSDLAMDGPLGRICTNVHCISPPRYTASTFHTRLLCKK